MSVRVRVTAVAVAVTAVALAIGGWGLVRSIERTQLGRIAAATEDRVDAVAARLAAGTPPEQLRLSVAAGVPGASVVQVIDNGTGGVVSSAPNLLIDPLMVIEGGAARVRLPARGSATVDPATGEGVVVESLPGTMATPVPFELRFRTVETPSGDLTVVAASPLDEVTRSLDAVRRSLRIGLPMVVALVGLIAWFVTGRALRPVEAMRAEADAITHSTLHRRVPVPRGGDEVGRLARTLNAMLDRLEASAERQRRFVADASHELRTPLATLRAELEVAQRANRAGPLREGVAGALDQEARLEALLADLLLLASVDESAPVELEPVDLGAVVGEEAERPRAVPVAVTGSGTVAGRPSQLARVVTNLLDNAARHATTAVVVTVDGGRLVVEDDGPGIPPEHRERVFERFTRLDEARARDAGGAGLGLSIVAAVVAAHGGTVAVDGSPALGGARVTVALPAADPTA